MRLRYKILSGFLILAVMLAVEGAWSILELHRAGTSAQALLDENYRSIQAGKGMVEALERQDSGVLLLLLGRAGEGRAVVAAADSAFGQHLAFAEGNVTVPGEQACLDSLRARYLAYRGQWQRLLADSARQGDLDWYNREVHVAFQGAKAASQALIDLNDQSMYHTADDLKTRSRRSITPGIIAAASALAFSVLFNFLVYRYVVQPLVRITRAADAFREYGKPFDVRVETRDELADLARSVEQLCLVFPKRQGQP